MTDTENNKTQQLMLTNDNDNLLRQDVIDSWSNEELLANLQLILRNSKGGVQMIYNEDDLVIGYQIIYADIDQENYFTSDPVVFPWPMQHLPFPEAFKKDLN